MSSLDIAGVLNTVPAVELIGAALYAEYRPRGGLMPTPAVPPDRLRAAIEQLLAIRSVANQQQYRLESLSPVPLAKLSLEYAL